MSELIVVKKIEALEVFTDVAKLDSILSDIREKAMAYAPDLSTVKGRKEIASIAYKVAQSKTALDKAGKDLVKDWKEKAKQVDLSRKKTREFLDDLKNEIRQPLTDYEDAEKAKAEKELRENEYNSDFDDAIRDHALFLREREIATKEAAIKAAEDARKEKEQAELAEKKRIEKEKAIEKAASEKAEAEAKAKAKATIAKAEEEKRLAEEAKKAAEKEKVEAVARAKAEKELADKLAVEAKKQAELDKMAAVAKAEEEKELAIQLAKEEAELKAKKAEEARLKAERVQADKDRVAAENLEHRRDVNNSALKAFCRAGIDEGTAKTIIKLVASGSIPRMTINY